MSEWRCPSCRSDDVRSVPVFVAQHTTHEHRTTLTGGIGFVGRAIGFGSAVSTTEGMSQSALSKLLAEPVYSRRAIRLPQLVGYAVLVVGLVVALSGFTERAAGGVLVGIGMMLLGLCLAAFIPYLHRQAFARAWSAWSDQAVCLRCGALWQQGGGGADRARGWFVADPVRGHLAAGVVATTGVLLLLVGVFSSPAVEEAPLSADLPIRAGSVDRPPSTLPPTDLDAGGSREPTSPSGGLQVVSPESADTAALRLFNALLEADSALTIAYRERMRALAESGGATGVDSLRQSQRRWLISRDSACGYRSIELGFSLMMDSSSMAGTTNWSQERGKQLRLPLP